MIWTLETLQSGSLVKEEFTEAEPFIAKFEEYYHIAGVTIVTATSSSVQ